MINTNICLMMNEAISLIKAEYRSLADFSKNFSIVLEYNKKLFNQKQNILFVIKKDRIIKKLKIEEIINKKFKNFKFKFFIQKTIIFRKKSLFFLESILFQINLFSSKI